MLPLVLAGAGVGLGMLKSKQQEEQANRDREVAAVTARYSPWTGMQPNMPQSVDTMGNMMQGGLAGASMGQGFEAAASNQALQDRQMSYLEKQGGGAGMAAVGASNAIAPMASQTPVRQEYVSAPAGQVEYNSWNEMASNPGMIGAPQAPMYQDPTMMTAANSPYPAMYSQYGG